MTETEPDIEETWREFWEPILMRDGVLDMEQLKKELSDFSFVMSQVPKVYMHITGGLLSKPHYFADTVIAAADDHADKMCEMMTDE